MSQGYHTPARRAVPRFVAALCLAGLVGGIALCMVQGSGDKGLRYAAAAQVYAARAQQGNLPSESVAYLNAAARETALQALTYDPASPAAWHVLSEVLLQQQEFGAAEQARRIAQNVGAPDDINAARVAAGFAPFQTLALEKE